MEHLADSFDSVGHVGRDKDIHGVGIVAQDIVGTSSYEHARILFGRLADGVALKFEKRFVTELVGVWVATTEDGAKELKSILRKPLCSSLRSKNFLLKPLSFAARSKSSLS